MKNMVIKFFISYKKLRFNTYLSAGFTLAGGRCCAFFQSTL